LLANVLKAPACARAFVSGNRSQAYLRAVSTKVKVVFRLVPRVPTAVMMATEIADGDKRYSMAVAPLASWANLASSLVRNLHLCRGSYVLVVTSMNKRNLLFGRLMIIGIAALAKLPNVKQVEKRGLILTRTNTDSSCSVMSRASTSRNASQIKDVHGRDNLGHAAGGRSRITLFGITRQGAPRKIATPTELCESHWRRPDSGGADGSARVLRR